MSDYMVFVGLSRAMVKAKIPTSGRLRVGIKVESM